MYCTKCGSELESGLKFCPECGTPVEESAAQTSAASAAAGAATVAASSVASATDSVSSESSYSTYTNEETTSAQPSYEAPSYSSASDTQADPLSSPECEQMCKSTMVTGILAAAFSCTFVLSFLGIIFGIIGLTKSSKCKKLGYKRPKMWVGFGLSIYGLVCGIIFTLYFLFYVIFMVGMISNLSI